MSGDVHITLTVKRVGEPTLVGMDVQTDSVDAAIFAARTMLDEAERKLKADPPGISRGPS